MAHQPCILDPVPMLGRFLAYDLGFGDDPKPALVRLRESVSPAHTVIGIGQPLALAVGAEIPGLRAFPAVTGPGSSFPSTQAALWAFLAGSSASDLHDRARTLRTLLGAGFQMREEVAAFQYRGGRDLSGFEDGTANPEDRDAVAAAIVSGRGEGLDGSSFVAAQRWVHDLEGFASLTQEERDDTIGRHQITNEEFEEAPASAHVKRTAQESFEPPAYMVRRSMPWGGVEEHGLYFVAYGESLDRFERVLRRMAGLDDGIVDSLLHLSRPVTGGYYWCPPVHEGRLDWRALGF